MDYLEPNTSRAKGVEILTRVSSPSDILLLCRLLIFCQASMSEACYYKLSIYSSSTVFNMSIDKANIKKANVMETDTSKIYF